MKIAIVILNWNGKELLQQFLPTVIQFSQGSEIYVADNASTDDSVAFVANHFPSVHIIKNKHNGGFAGGYNEALQQVDADLYCLLNSDVEVTENWLTPVLDFFKTHPEVVIAQPKILDYKNKEYFEYAGAAGGFIDQLGYPFCRGRVFQTLEKDEGQYDDITEVFWATGACMFVKSTVFHELHGFDEDYFAHQEEIDFCWRAKNKGYKVFYIGTSKIYHVGGATLHNMNPKKTFLNFRNSLFSITKNLPLTKVFVLVFFRLILDGIAGVRFLYQLKFQHLKAIIRAHFSFYKNFRKMYTKRSRGVKKEKYYCTTSVVLSYFVFKKKCFYQLLKD
ncbi:glycosyltransferase family 2 protein [Zhouia sp. PK063]|uniref:glycosyltransferase family 2 protein n=1 Tax=Zhouia sp. PK063 TaxID=3373602 RepID=UPI003791E437